MVNNYQKLGAENCSMLGGFSVAYANTSQQNVKSVWSVHERSVSERVERHDSQSLQGQ